MFLILYGGRKLGHIEEESFLMSNPSCLTLKVLGGPFKVSPIKKMPL